MQNKYILIGLIKISLVLLVFISATVFFVLTYFYASKGRTPRISSVEPTFLGQDLIILPYSSKTYAGYGRVFEPEIEIKVKDKRGNPLKINFLLDSGAVVSTLPESYADELGTDIKNVKRIVLRGFGNQRSFGYMTEMTLLIKDNEYKIPVVLSEGEVNKKILGRNGFFDIFTITFDTTDKVIRISK